MSWPFTVRTAAPPVLSLTCTRSPPWNDFRSPFHIDPENTRRPSTTIVTSTGAFAATTVETVGADSTAARGDDGRFAGGGTAPPLESTPAAPAADSATTATATASFQFPRRD